MSPGVVGANCAHAAGTNNNPRTERIASLRMLRRRREYPAVSWVDRCLADELLFGGHHISVFLHLISLVCRFAGHIFKLELPQLLELCDLFRGQLAGEVNCVIPVQEVPRAEGPQYPEHSLFGRE